MPTPTFPPLPAAGRLDVLQPVGNTQQHRRTMSALTNSTSIATTIPRPSSAMAHDSQSSNPLSPHQDAVQEYLGGHADALEALGISYQRTDGTPHISHVTAERNRAAMQHLATVFDVVDIHFCEPFVVLGCKPKVPEGLLPKSVGGLITIWRTADDMDFMPVIGECGQMEGETEIDPLLLVGFEENQMPTDTAIAGLATNVFPDCEAITFLIRCLVVELPKSEDEIFWARLEHLPSSIKHAPFVIQYHNGPVPNAERRKREQRPKPQATEDKRVADETDYIAKDGKLYPGTMINSIDKHNNTYGSVSAGVLVRKGTERRLTCSFHCWEDHYKKYPGLLGKDDDEAKQVFSVIQGEKGTRIGHLQERIGATDIGLAKLDAGVVFENAFKEVDAVAKRFLHSTFVNLWDAFYIDGFPIGKQRLMSLGRRFQISRKSGEHHHHLMTPDGDESRLPPDNIAYISAKQGVCGTGDPVLTTKPHIRDRTCGAVLLRCKSGLNPRETEATVMARGEICGMFHYADLTARNATAAGSYLIYADAFDPLIEDGWTIVPGPGEVEEPNVTGCTTDVAEESPSKRLRMR